jgi:hypothetical protein
LDAGGSLIARRGSRSAIMAARQANEVMLPFYVLHKPVVVAAVWAMSAGRADPREYVSLVIVPFGGTLARTKPWCGGFASPGCCSA